MLLLLANLDRSQDRHEGGDLKRTSLEAQNDLCQQKKEIEEITT